MQVNKLLKQNMMILSCIQLTVIGSLDIEARLRCAVNMLKT